MGSRAKRLLEGTHRPGAHTRYPRLRQTLTHHVKAPAATGAKKQKKKWSKGKVKDKAQHAVILDKATSDRLQKEVQSYRLVTVATLVDRLKINGSLARRSLADLEEQGQIKKVVSHSKCLVYSAS
ncbi:hypothetical protein E4T42_05730 [Aureobasidium subglaciale]|nr:hypothetical protein E4T38_07091 [Aureobasidium subglaciale]KAI5218247.1 hypothetical protein E4T40_07022 [Aureobasidium subglaciale]KAI5221686.1 hypothetical protein E4T41_06942 [Aureobasidium subglaciale]KAI5248363.1 hypothetical protein E4T42_05730 [Aureobasidium subglaciale]KAI5259131.1 hypothetical protein E4T46_06920 [Aureobasidium subglaciale]